MLKALFATALLTLTTLSVASAQTPAQVPPGNAPAVSDQTIKGRIVAIKDPFHIVVRDDKGAVENVTLHRGTIINPTGLTLAAGMRVSIMGYAADNAFAANEIDTPYTYRGPLPLPMYYGPGWWYPGFGYGFGPAFGFSVRGGPNPGFQRVPFPHGAPAPQPPNAPRPNRRVPER